VGRKSVTSSRNSPSELHCSTCSGERPSSTPSGSSLNHACPIYMYTRFSPLPLHPSATIGELNCSSCFRLTDIIP
jgi:hypothetical protein